MQELHSRAWDLVGTYLTANLRIFGGLAKEAESTVLPVLSTWIDEAFQEVPECRAPEDHGLVIWANLPTCGVISVHRYEWCITSISNLLAKFKRNGIAILVHPNRGQVSERTLVDQLVEYGAHGDVVQICPKILNWMILNDQIKNMKVNYWIVILTNCCFNLRFRFTLSSHFQDPQFFTKNGRIPGGSSGAKRIPRTPRRSLMN